MVEETYNTDSLHSPERRRYEWKRKETKSRAKRGGREGLV